MSVAAVHERGDTIVEVLIAMAIVSAVLGSTFVAMNRSYKSSVQAQERSAAVKIAERQLELIRVNTSVNPTLVYLDDGKVRCFGSPLTGNKYTTYENYMPIGSWEASTEALKESASDYTTECADEGIGNRYYLGFVYDDSENMFTVRVRWEGINEVRDEVTMRYRKPQP